MGGKKNYRRMSAIVTAQTLFNLHKLSKASGYGDNIGKVIDKLTRDRMVSLHIIDGMIDGRQIRKEDL